VSGVEESVAPGLTTKEAVLELALRKARAVGAGPSELDRDRL